MTFAEAGSPSVTLAITTTRECIEYVTTSEVNVICCGDQFTGTGTAFPVSCPDADDGRIDFTGSSNVDGAPLTYEWSNGATTPSLADLALGSYTVTLTDGTGCEYIDSFAVGGPEAYVFDTLITMPDCGGASNGVLEFTILSGGAGDYSYSFDGGPLLQYRRAAR